MLTNNPERNRRHHVWHYGVCQFQLQSNFHSITCTLAINQDSEIQVNHNQLHKPSSDRVIYIAQTKRQNLVHQLIFKLEHGFKLTQSSILILTNNPERNRRRHLWGMPIWSKIALFFMVGGRTRIKDCIDMT